MRILLSKSEAMVNHKFGASVDFHPNIGQRLVFVVLKISKIITVIINQWLLLPSQYERVEDHTASRMLQWNIVDLVSLNPSLGNKYVASSTGYLHSSACLWVRKYPDTKRDRDIIIWMFVWGKGWLRICMASPHSHSPLHTLKNVLLPTDKLPSFSHLRLVYVLCFFSSSRFGSRAIAQRGLSAHSSSSVFLLNNPPNPSPPLLSDSLIQLWAAPSARRITIIAS